MPGADLASGGVAPEEVERLFAPLKPHEHLVLAVSGGADSVGLMVLAAGWAKLGEGAPRFTVLTVDHGLRAEAADEARQVGLWARALGFEHHMLCWQAAKPESGVQAAARAARYDLMTEWCLANGASGIVTAHTADDQAETVLMRLARGSGVDGLSGMLEETPSPWPVLRPLLDVTGARLRAVLVEAGQAWIEDPSNDDDAYERIRMRRALEVLAPLGLGAEQIGLSARRLARARAALEAGRDELIGAALKCHAAGFGELDLAVFGAAPDELRLRALQALVWQFGSHEMPRMAVLERLLEWIDAGDGRARVMAGCRIVRRQRLLVFGREPGRVERMPVKLTQRKSGARAVWDRRFDVRITGVRASDELSLVPFCAVNDENFGDLRPKTIKMPAFVRESLPVLLDHGELHSVPHLGLAGRQVNSNLCIDVKFLEKPLVLAEN